MTSSIDFPKAPANASEDMAQAYMDAADGDMEALLDLGLFSDDSDGIPMAHRLFFLTKAAEAGNIHAMRGLTHAYLKPGELHDFDKARTWCTIAEEHGDPSANCCGRILDVLGDEDSGMLSDAYEELYQIGSENEFDPVGLGDSFFTGSDNVEEDMGVAFRFYLAAAAEGNAEARRKVGYMYEHGLGVEKSLEDAAGYYALACWDDDEAGWLFRSLIYREGDIRIPDWALETERASRDTF